MSAGCLYAPGMRDDYPDLCWRVISGGTQACIRERGHDGGIHEPDAVARRSGYTGTALLEREHALLEAARLALASYPWPPRQPLSDADVYMERLREAVRAYS